MTEKYTWLHIGLGSFHRAHQAWYLHRLIAGGDTRWHIAAGNIRNDAEHVVQALAAQKGRYVLETVSPEGERDYEEIASIQTLIPWQADLQPLIAEGANPQTRVIAFTVTEGGYYLDTSHRPDGGKSASPPFLGTPATGWLWPMPIWRAILRAAVKPSTGQLPASSKRVWRTERVR